MGDGFNAARALGEAAADTLMELLPPVGWADVATKSDLDHMAVLLRTEMAQLRSDMEAGHASLRAEMHTGFAQLRGEMDRCFRRQTQFLMATIIASQGVLVAALKLLPSRRRLRASADGTPPGLVLGRHHHVAGSGSSAQAPSHRQQCLTIAERQRQLDDSCGSSRPATTT